MATRSTPAGDEESESIFLPGYRNYLVYCDDSGLHGSTHYAFGSLWIPAERRGDFPALVTSRAGGHSDGLPGQNAGQKPLLERRSIVREHRPLHRGEQHYAHEARGPRRPGP